MVLYAAKYLEAIRRQGYRTFGFFQFTEETKPVLELLAQDPLGKMKTCVWWRIDGEQ